jgi:hypothetical protein
MTDPQSSAILFHSWPRLRQQFPRSRSPTFLASGMAIIWAIALAKLLFHIYFNNRYGYFRDEFDYMSCGDHLAWGYVDQPPLIPFLISHLPCRTRRFSPQHSLHPRSGFFAASSSNRRARPRVRRTPLRPAPQRHHRRHRAAISYRTPACLAPTASNPIFGWAAPTSPSSPSSAAIPATGSGSA